MDDKIVFTPVTTGYNAGGYDLVHEFNGSVLCSDCANALDEDEKKEVTSDIYYEGPSLECDGGCGTFIESAYGDPEDDED